MAEYHTKSELELLSIIEEEQVISQSVLSKRLGIAAGLVNFLMKRAVSKGLVKVQKVPARRYAYFLTPKGFAEKVRLVADYMNASLRMFRNLRDDFGDLFTQLLSNGSNRVVIVGDMELAEVALLACLDSDVEIVAIVCAATNRSNLAGIAVVSHTDLLNDLSVDDKFVVGDIYHSQKVYNDLVERFGSASVCAPKSLRITPIEDALPSPRRAGASK